MTERDYGRPEGWDELPYVPMARDLDAIGTLTITPNQAEYLLINGIADKSLSQGQLDVLQRISDLDGPDVEGDLVKELREVYKQEA